MNTQIHALLSRLNRNPFGLAVLLVLLTSSPALAHFPWLLSQKGVAHIILSETLQMDYGVDGDLVSTVTVSFQGADGQSRPVPVRKAKQDYVVDVAGSGTLYGKLDMGIMKRGATSHVLVYFPKAIVGDPFGEGPRTVSAPVEFVVAGTKDVPRLKLLVDGKPLPDSEIRLVLPDNTEKSTKTDAQGLSEPLITPGRYGVWARHWVKETGERGGVAYEEVRRYATLVVDIAGGSESPQKSVTPAEVSKFGRLPEATSSFGAAMDQGFLYVYGGHITPTHDYSKAAVSGAFNRLNVASGAWESLPGATTVQGMNLAAHRGKIYRVGGMRPENDPGQPADTRSLSEASRFDVVTRQWEPLPALPAPRSSHEMAVVGNKLVVVGGWNMRGVLGSSWADTLEVLDLDASPMKWQTIAQPFKRRAFVAAVRGGSIYVVGGFDENNTVLSSLEIYDVASNSWSKGPDLPKGSRNGFSPAACVLDGRIYVSLGDGGVYRLVEDPGAMSWEKVARSTARIAHRMVPHGSNQLLVAGGAANGDNLDLIESVSVRVAPEVKASSGR